jgi:hypothetical protein
MKLRSIFNSPFNLTFLNDLRKKKIQIKKKFFNIIENIKIKQKQIIFKTIKYNTLKVNNIFLKTKLMNVLHFYTGYANINIIGKPITLVDNFEIECKTNIISKYIKFFTNLILKNNYNNLDFEMKYAEVRGDKAANELLSNTFDSSSNIKSKLELFFRKFPFYIIKQHKKFLTKLFYLLNLKNQDPKNIFLILKNSFYYIYKVHGTHFFRAFKFYKSLINKLYKCNILKVYGLKLIFKGRFGKVRKQIQKLYFGSLQLNKFLTKIIYYNSIMLTKRGSYGFHMWIASR